MGSSSRGRKIFSILFFIFLLVFSGAKTLHKLVLVKIVTQAIWFCDMLHELVLHAIAEVSVMILIEGQKIGVLINRKPKNKKTYFL